MSGAAPSNAKRKAWNRPGSRVGILTSSSSTAASWDDGLAVRDAESFDERHAQAVSTSSESESPSPRSGSKMTGMHPDRTAMVSPANSEARTQRGFVRHGDSQCSRAQGFGLPGGCTQKLLLTVTSNRLLDAVALQSYPGVQTMPLCAGPPAAVIASNRAPRMAEALLRAPIMRTAIGRCLVAEYPADVVENDATESSDVGYGSESSNGAPAGPVAAMLEVRASARALMARDASSIHSSGRSLWTDEVEDVFGFHDI
eukprot:743767-Prymnesium_polylepis.1